MEWITALGIAYGGTYAVSMPLRTVRYPSIFWSMFCLSYFFTVWLFYYVDLELNLQIFLALGGVLIGAALTFLRRKTLALEKDYEKARMARGEKKV